MGGKWLGKRDMATLSITWPLGTYGIKARIWRHEAAGNTTVFDLRASRASFAYGRLFW